MPDPLDPKKLSEEARLRHLLGEDEERDMPSEIDRRAEEFLELQKDSKVSDVDEVDREFEDRIQQIDSKLSNHKIKEQAKRARDEQVLRENLEQSTGLNQGLQLAYGMLGLTGLGIAIGYVLSLVLHNPSILGYGAAAGTVLGIGFVTYQMASKN